MIQKITLFLLVILFISSCQKPDPNTNEKGNDELTSLEVAEPIRRSDVAYEDIRYVPIYSDIYVDANNQQSLLAATLSIRNTSFTDSIFISQIDYFDTKEIIRSFILGYLKIRLVSLPWLL